MSKQLNKDPDDHWRDLINRLADQLPEAPEPQPVHAGQNHPGLHPALPRQIAYSWSLLGPKTWAFVGSGLTGTPGAVQGFL